MAILKPVKQLRDTFQSDKLRVYGLKQQYIDGVITACTAYLLEPYADQPVTWNGFRFGNQWNV